METPGQVTNAVPAQPPAAQQAFPWKELLTTVASVALPVIVRWLVKLISDSGDAPADQVKNPPG